MKCPKCGWFLKNVVATVNGLEEIIKVQGECKRCGVVEPNDWAWDDFFPELERLAE